ncbi:MAG: KGG domain-containing protein, partial [Polyangiaceae bacterium]
MGAKRKQGFAAMDPQLRKTIASRGGKAAHATGHAHEFSADEARAAGWKGGMVVSGDRAYMAELGRRGGYARARNRRARA